MMIKYTPISVFSDGKVYDKNSLSYEFPEKGVLKVIYNFNGNKQEDIFDFKDLPDGEASNILSKLPINPILKAYKEDGVLHLHLKKFVEPKKVRDKKYGESKYRFSTSWQAVDI